MSEFVKKTIVGYKDVPGGSSDPDCTHVILTLNEYKKIVRERDEAIRTVGIERQNADRQMNEEKKNAAYQIRQVRDQAVKEIAEMQGALAQAQKDAAYQRHLNENLLRISRERANADRGLKPKKEHTGYVVMNMQEKKLQRKNSRGYYTITLNGLMTETRATKHERKPGRWHPSRLSLCWNFANLLGYGHYTTPIVVYASGE